MLELIEWIEWCVEASVRREEDIGIGDEKI